MNEYFNNVDFLGIFKKRIKLFIIISISAAAISYFFSSPIFIKPLFISNAVIYPSNLSSFSEESPSEQLLQMFSSDDIKFAFAKKFNLVEHYRLKPDSKYLQSELLFEIGKKVNIYKNEYESINVDVIDENPKIACTMVKSLIDLVNAKILEIHRQRFGETVKIWKDEMDIKKKEMDSLKKSIDSLRTKSGIIDFDGQLREASRQFFTMTKSESPKDNNYLTQFMKKLQGNGAEIFTLTQSFNLAVSEYNRLRLQYEAALVNYKKEIKYTNIVAEPYVADKKFYPLRGLIVLITVLSALIISSVTFVYIEKIKQIK